MNQTSEDNYGYNLHDTLILHCWFYEGEAHLFTLIIVSICLPLILAAICTLYLQLQNEHVAPVYVINLLMSDIIQLCCMIVKLADVQDGLIREIFFFYVYNCSVMASVNFMVCIALERYLLVVWPVWYRLKRTIRFYVIICASVWVMSAFIGIIHQRFLGVFLLLPLPPLIFFMVGTIRALYAVQSVSTNEKRRIGAVLVMVVLTYSLVYLPRFLLDLHEVFTYFLSYTHYNYDYGYDTSINFSDVTCTLIQLNPLTDLVLYVLISKRVMGMFLACLRCCRKTNNDDISRSTVLNDENRNSAAERGEKTDV